MGGHEERGSFSREPLLPSQFPPRSTNIVPSAPFCSGPETGLHCHCPWMLYLYFVVLTSAKTSSLRALSSTPSTCSLFPVAILILGAKEVIARVLVSG